MRGDVFEKLLVALALDQMKDKPLPKPIQPTKEDGSVDGPALTTWGEVAEYQRKKGAK